jgi:hypothetical protein
MLRLMTKTPRCAAPPLDQPGAHEARALKAIGADLANRIGRRPRPHEREMIETAARLQLRMNDLDWKLAKAGSRTQTAARSYREWSDAYKRIIGAIGCVQDYAAMHPAPLPCDAWRRSGRDGRRLNRTRKHPRCT